LVPGSTGRRLKGVSNIRGTQRRGWAREGQVSRQVAGNSVVTLLL
jgi:hypothetical protein